MESLIQPNIQSGCTNVPVHSSHNPYMPNINFPGTVHQSTCSMDQKQQVHVGTRQMESSNSIGLRKYGEGNFQIPGAHRHGDQSCPNETVSNAYQTPVTTYMAEEGRRQLNPLFQGTNLSNES